MTTTPADRPALSVLIADPHADAAESLACLLRLFGHAVAVAATGPDALAAAALGSPDVAVLELRLPGLDGWEVARRLRAVGSPPACVAVTTCGRPGERRRSAAAGIALHLLKGAEPDDLTGYLTRYARTLHRRLQPG